MRGGGNVPRESSYKPAGQHTPQGVRIDGRSTEMGGETLRKKRGEKTVRARISKRDTRIKGQMSVGGKQGNDFTKYKERYP